MYTATTHAITVTAQPTYLEDQSEPLDSRFVWAYHIRINNGSNRTVQLLSRTWQITDGFGRRQEVQGAGVVGEQPVLKPGQTFEYTSGTPLPTPSGIMVGTYQMEAEDGERFVIDVPAFSLDSPHQAVRLN